MRPCSPCSVHRCLISQPCMVLYRCASALVMYVPAAHVLHIAKVLQISQTSFRLRDKEASRPPRQVPARLLVSTKPPMASGLPFTGQHSPREHCFVKGKKSRSQQRLSHLAPSDSRKWVQPRDKARQPIAQNGRAPPSLSSLSRRNSTSWGETLAQGAACHWRLSYVVSRAYDAMCHLLGLRVNLSAFSGHSRFSYWYRRKK